MEDEIEYMIYAPLACEPPMAYYRELEDGTYSIDDILRMNLIMQWKAKVTKVTKPNEN